MLADMGVICDAAGKCVNGPEEGGHVETVREASRALFYFAGAAMLTTILLLLLVIVAHKVALARQT